MDSTWLLAAWRWNAMCIVDLDYDLRKENNNTNRKGEYEVITKRTN